MEIYILVVAVLVLVVVLADRQIGLTGTTALLKHREATIKLMSEADELTALMVVIQRDNAKWWVDLETGAPLNRNVGEMLALVHSEISEALEGHRKGLMDDHLTDRPMFDVELADAVIRILDIAAGLKVDLVQVIYEKLAYNRQRADHKVEARRQANGKKY